MGTGHRPSVKPFALTVGAGIVLYAIWLAELPVGPRPRADGALSQTASSPVKSQRPSSAKSVERMRGHASSAVDRESFLAGFARQSGEKLVPCLRRDRGSAGHVTFIARLSRQGQLKAIRLVEPLGPAPACILEAVGEMDFASLGKSLTDDSVEIQWKFTW